MHGIAPIVPRSPMPVLQPVADSEPPDIWFDAVDHIDMDKQWFDGLSQTDGDEIWQDVSDELPFVEQCIPFTEDCRRCVKELIRYVGEVKEKELLFAGLSGILPGLPTDAVLAAHALYLAVTERKDIDMAMLSAIGLASSYFLDSGNMISRTAHFIRETVRAYIGESYFGQFFSQDADQEARYFFTGLAVLAMVARHWITDEGAPQRRLLRVPAFLGNLLLRTSVYWNHLGRMAQHAAQVCYLTVAHSSGVHRYHCVEETGSVTAPNLQRMEQSSWLCTRMDKAATSGVAIPSCSFSAQRLDHPRLPAKPVSSAADRESADVTTQALIVASAATVTATVRPPDRLGKSMLAASLALAATVVLMAGKLMRDALFPRRSENQCVARAPDAQAIVAPVPAKIGDLLTHEQAHAVATSMPTSFAPQLLCRRRLIGYLHSIRLFSSNEVSDKEIARAALQLIREDEKHQTALAHIALYGTGLFGERHDEYLDPSAQVLLVGDLLARLLFGQRSLDTYLLETFYANRRISIEDFHKKITGWSFDIEDAELTRFFNERFLFPFMPVLNVDLKKDDPRDEHRLVLVGSATWFFLYIGSKFVWTDASRHEQQENAEEMVLFGAYIFRMLMKEQLVEGSSQVIALGINIAGLFLHPGWTPATLPALQKVQWLVGDALKMRIKSDSTIARAFDAAKVELEKAASEPWHSRGAVAAKLLLKHCGDTNAQLYILPKDAHLKAKTPQQMLKKITSKKSNSTGTLMASKEHAYCYSKTRKIIKIPTVDYHYRTVIAEFVHALKEADRASLSKLFSISDVYSNDFSYDDYQFINQAALTEVKLVVIRDRPLRELMTFSQVVHTWKPNEHYLFFNASLNGKTHTYVTNRTANDYWIKRLDTNNLLNELPPFFDTWPVDTLKRKISAVFSSDHNSVRTASTESISTFIEGLVDKRYQGAEKILYDSGYETPIGEAALEFILEVFVPFYSCVTSMQKGDASGAVIGCVLDGFFTLGPLVKGGVVIVKTGLRALGKRVLIKIVEGPSFIASQRVVSKKKITIKRIIASFDLCDNDETLSMGKSAFFLILDALDPGVGLLINAHKAVADFGKLFVSGNMIAMIAHVSRNWRSVAEASVRVKSLTDSRKILVRVSKINNRDEDFEPEINRTAKPISLNYKKNTAFLALVYYDAGYYNIFRLGKSDNAVLASETGELASRGNKVYVMLNARSPTGIFVKYTCSPAVQNSCILSPWLPPAIKASIIKLSAVIEKGGDKTWLFDGTKNMSQPFFYPDHQCEISEDGYSPNKVYDIIEIATVFYVFDLHEPYLRPLHSGDKIVIVPRQRQNYTLSPGRDQDGNIVMTCTDKPGLDSQDAVQLLTEKYATTNFGCADPDAIVSHATDDSLIARIGNKCFHLKLSRIRNQFLIVSPHFRQPSLKVGWSSKDKRWAPVAPHTGTSSPHVGISLEAFIKQQRQGHCEGIVIKRIPTSLISGAVMHEGNTWLYVDGYYYRLGAWREGICPLYCSNTNYIAAWLQYDLFTESFELVHDGDAWEAAKNNLTEAVFNKLAKLTVQGRGWYELTQGLGLGGSRISVLMLRLYQTTFLQSLRSTDRMELLSLPAAFVRSWSLHPDARVYNREYPALALGLSLQRQRAPAAGVSLTQMYLLHRMYLNHQFIDRHYSPGKLIVGSSGDHNAVWIEDQQGSSGSGIFLKRHELNFYGEHLTSNDGMLHWVPDGHCAPARAVIQFMQESKVRPELLTDIDRRNIWIAYVDWGLVQLRRQSGESRIDYALISPGAHWAAVIDSESYLSLFALQGLFAQQGSVVDVVNRQRLPDDLKPQDYALCVVSDAGEFYYPGNFTWHRINDRHALWSSPPGFVPILISPDQRFLGFEHPQRSGTLLYDQQEKRLLMLQRPAAIAASAKESLSAIAFAPLNVVVALAFDDSKVYLYDLANGTVQSNLDPVAQVQLRELHYVNNTASYRYKQSIVMRFEGVFRYLTVIYHMGIFGPMSDMNSRKIIYDIYGFASTANRKTDEVAGSKEKTPEV